MPLFRMSLFIAFVSSLSAAPPPDYWQQEVNYRIAVELQPGNRVVEGTIDIQYINNSPDTLRVLYLKAFANAVQEGSHSDMKRREQNEWQVKDRAENAEGLMEISDIMPLPRPYASWRRDNTITTVSLTSPLLPGDTLEMSFGFKTVFPKPHDLRMGNEQGTLKGTYWYPQVCVYDWKMGWVNAQYLDWGECYGDFGRFEVEITAPANQVIAATGVNTNESEMLPDSLFSKLYIGNFIDTVKNWPEFNFTGLPEKTWRFVAERVNDFAFIASDSFCIDTGSYNEVQIYSYALRSSAKKWKKGVQLGVEALQTFSEQIYPYKWPVLRIVDCHSGMEFPMVATCRGGAPDPGWWIVVYHEIGHQWFMGQVGSNQVDRPFLDEGFTTFIEHFVMEKYRGRAGDNPDFPDGNNILYKNWYGRTFGPPNEDRDQRGFRPLMGVIKQDMDKPMAFSYDQGEEYLPYRYSAYYKAASMHHALYNILGDSLYFKAMHDYCRDWFFKHPYEGDFKESIEQSTGFELDLYFDQWFYGRQRLDYGYGGEKSKRTEGKREHEITIHQKGRFVSPLDIAVLWKTGDTSLYTVSPEGIEYAKPGYTALPTWHQLRRFDKKYSFTIQDERNIEKVVLDPQDALVDMNHLNDASGFPSIELRLDNMKYDVTPLRKYALRARPDFWYDLPNGSQVGFHAHGSYLETEYKFSLDAGFASKSELPVVDLSYSNTFRLLGAHSERYIRAIRSDNRTFLSLGFTKSFRNWFERPDGTTIRIGGSYYNLDNSKSSIPLPAKPTVGTADPELAQYFGHGGWTENDVFLESSETRTLQTFRYGSFGGSFRQESGVTRLNAAFDSLPDDLIGFSQFTVQNWLELSRSGKEWLYLEATLFTTDGTPPEQFEVDLSSGRLADHFTESRIFRSPGTFPRRWKDDFYLANGPVRGYQGREIVTDRYLSAKLEVALPDPLPFRWFGSLPCVGNFLSQMDLRVFADISRAHRPDTPRRVYENYISAGLSLSLPPVWSHHYLRLDFPIYISKPPVGEAKSELRFSASWLLAKH